MTIYESWEEFAAAAGRQASRLHLTSVAGRVRDAHERVKQRHPAVDRVSAALYDPGTGMLRTFVDTDEASGQASRLDDGCRLADAPSLLAIAESGQPRVLDALGTDPESGCSHARSLHRQGYRSSLTLLMRHHDELVGFLFFDSRQPQAYSADVAAELLLVGDLIGMIVTQQLATLRALVGGLRLASQFARVRDLETGAHLSRMARYAHLIAAEVAPDHGLTSEYAEHVFLFAALHDIGKVGIPDRILLKPGRLDPAELEIMRRHVAVGVEMAEQMIAEFELHQLPNIDMLRNIVGAHHERMDGTGYPNGIPGGAIPLEARIVATADVFDALTCARSYKPGWLLDDAFAEIVRMSGDKLYGPTVDALVRRRDEVETIFRQFSADAEV